MPSRRPLVRVGGRTRQLPAGDAVAGFPLYLRAYNAEGAMLKLALDIHYALPVQQAAGGALTLAVVLNG